MFTTKDGNEYSINFTISTIKKLKLAGIDISKDNGIFDVASDMATMSDALWCLCESQCNEKQIDQQAFFDSFDGDVLEAAGKDMLEAFINFSPKSRRDLLRQTVSKLENLDNQMFAKIKKNLDEITEEKITEAIESTLSIS